MPGEDPLLDKFDSLGPDFFGTYMRQVEVNRQYYDLRYANVVVPDRWRDRLRPLIPPTARQAVDEAVDHMLYTPKIRVPVRPTDSDGITEQEIAEKKRKFLNSWWHQVTQRYNALGDGRKPLINEGKIAVRKTLRWDLLPDKDSSNYRRDLEKLGRTEFLWDVELLDNVTVYEDPSNHRNPKYVYLHYEVLVEVAKDMFPEATGEWTRQGDYDKVRYVEYWSAPTFHSDGTWDEGKFVQWIERERVHDSENPYPYIPIAIEDAGFGDNRKLAKVEERFVGMTQHTHDVFEAEARQMTSLEAVTELTAFPMITTRNMDETKQIKVGPGEVNALEGGDPRNDPTAESIEITQMPEVPVSVIQLIEKTTQIANSTLKMNVLGGIAQRGVDTATEADQNVRNASTKLGAPVAAMERIAAKLSRWVLMDVEMVLEAPVTIFGAGMDDPAEVHLTPREISGYYDVHVELGTTDQDAVNQIKARFWAELYRVVPFLSGWTAMERGGMVDDPMQEMLRRAAEDVFLSPEMAMVRTMTGAQSFGELANMIQQITQGGAGEQAPGGNSAEGLVEQGNLNLPLTPREQLRDEAMVNRDLRQMMGQFRA